MIIENSNHQSWTRIMPVDLLSDNMRKDKYAKKCPPFFPAAAGSRYYNGRIYNSNKWIRHGNQSLCGINTHAQFHFGPWRPSSKQNNASITAAEKINFCSDQKRSAAPKIYRSSSLGYRENFGM